MNILKILAHFLIAFYIFSFWYTHAAINYTLSPLKYEINVDPWDVITRSAQIRNNGIDPVVLTTASSDFEAKGDGTGTPLFVRYSELVNPDQELSSWISIDQASISLNPGETGAITFTITVPSNATPWGHYGAVFFKNPDSESSAGAEIGINVDYWVLVLVNVSGEIIVDVDIEPIIIWWGSSSSSSSSSSWGASSTGWNWSSWGGSGSGGWWSWWWGGGSSSWTAPSTPIDSCPFGDLTSSNFDGKCIDNFLQPSEPEEENFEPEFEPENQNTWVNVDTNSWTTNTPIPEPNNFEITFNLPINNNGNSHVEPVWKIKLKDESGKEIKNIGKEVKRNDYGAVIGEDIVHYLPLNDKWGKVLPNTKRNFDTSWKGFPYKEYTAEGDQIIKYRNPWEYYTSQNIEEDKFMMPWERVCKKIQTKTITADIEIAYKDAKGDDVQYNSADEFEIEYTEEYIGLNPYVIIPFFLLIGLWLLFWFILARKKKICINKDCKEKIKRSAKICPYCDTKQKRGVKEKQDKNKKDTKKKSSSKIKWKKNKDKSKKDTKKKTKK